MNKDLYQNQIRDMSTLEKKTLEELLQMFEEDGVNFIINDGEIVDYEVEE